MFRHDRLTTVRQRRFDHVRPVVDADAHHVLPRARDGRQQLHAFERNRDRGAVEQRANPLQPLAAHVDQREHVGRDRIQGRNSAILQDAKVDAAVILKCD